MNFYIKKHIHTMRLHTTRSHNDRRKSILLLGLILLCLGSGLLYFSFRQMETAAERIAAPILRFHVIANSDSAEDQALKLEVKEALLAILNNSPADSKEEMVAYVEEHRDELRAAAREILREKEKDDSIRIVLTNTYFPTKVYGDLTFPCGYYDALRVEIGQAAGKNWWCVLYPPLCFADVTTGFVPEASKEELKEVLTDEDYAGLETNASGVTYGFRLFEWWEKIFPSSQAG